ncbi:MAG TPA: ABC transporter ATP-binding protein [Rubrobacteraceae bacterium]|nr:ABC transporter ATP-binding protein [Rubrobacteraceae bacterium]
MRILPKKIKRAFGELTKGVREGEGLVAASPVVSVREVFRRFWPYARPYRRWIPVMLFLVALGPAVNAVLIWMYKILVDDVLVAQNLALLGPLVLAYLALMVLDGVVSFCDEYLAEWVGGSFTVSLRTEFFRHLHGLSLDFFDREKLGDLISRLSDDVDEIEELMLSGATSALAYVFQLVFFVGALFYLDWQLALLSLFVAPLFWFVARRFSRRIKQASREERRRAGSIGAVAEESLSNAALVQAYAREKDEVARFHRENEGGFAAQMAATRLTALFSPLINLIELAGVLVVIVVGAWQVSRGALTIGGLLVFMVYLSQLYRPIRGLSSLLNTVYAASAGAERIIEFLDRKPSVQDASWARPIQEARGIVEFDSVSFRYPGAERLSLEDVSFSVWPGQTLALVGESGAGKSTVARLLLRFYDPQSGSVRLDGHDLGDLTLDSLRGNVAVLLQETLVFDGTVRENIAYGKPDATEEEIIRAARAADAHDFILALPEGYDTVVGQKGRLLSGGQRQRIAIARAMVRDAPVLILDEPTTGLDAGSGRRIMEPLRRLMEGRTTIIISHDLSTVREATEVLVLDGGRVTERGTHAELLSHGGVYARLYELHAPNGLRKEVVGS